MATKKTKVKEPKSAQTKVERPKVANPYIDDIVRKHIKGGKSDRTN